ncbi:hypothetical protein Y1Q_0004813 [Alligator mississippiensis]|uniref:Uncharacterized protein n=1 Tax=Alligator mississippiensis TaxID=8496 RepID=A0A151NQV9_ALLMI|nr:hypothetical protein Y1Q_0004813 [Alligator mississippiensis]
MCCEEQGEAARRPSDSSWRLAYGRDGGEVEPHGYPTGGVTYLGQSLTGEPTSEDSIKVVAGDLLSVGTTRQQPSAG